MKDIVYVQKSVVLDAILLCVIMIIATCVIPLTIIFKAAILVICGAITLLVLMITAFILVINYNSIGIGFNGIVLKKFNKRKLILWRDVANIEIKVFHGKATIVRYVFTIQNHEIIVNNDARVLDLLIRYCNSNEKLEEILQQRHKELEGESG